MLSSQTPFKIHDENGSTFTAHKSTKKGLGTVEPSNKKSRKALIDLSSSQVNARIATPSSLSIKSSSASVNKLPEKKSKNVHILVEKAPASHLGHDDIDIRDMMSSGKQKLLDPYDEMLRKAAKLTSASNRSKGAKMQSKLFAMSNEGPIFLSGNDGGCGFVDEYNPMQSLSQPEMFTEELPEFM